MGETRPKFLKSRKLEAEARKLFLEDYANICIVPLWVVLAYSARMGDYTEVCIVRHYAEICVLFVLVGEIRDALALHDWSLASDLFCEREKMILVV